MEKILPIAQQLSRARWLAPLVIALTLTTLAATIYFGATQLRPGLRSQIVSHDGEVLMAVARAEQSQAPAVELDWQLQNPAGQFALALRLSNLKEGVLAARLFDAHGQCVAAAPASVLETDLTRAELAQLTALQPVSRFEPAARLEDYFFLAPASASARQPEPLHLVLLPLHAPGQTNLLAVAQLIVEGHTIAREFTRLDRHLWRQGLAAFALSGSVLALALAWAFRWLGQINRRLQEQAAHLRRANQELALAAKASALGSVTAHLMHGLSSPLTGLHNYVTSRAPDDAEAQDALRSTQRMQALIGETVRLLSEERGNRHYELPLAELVEVLVARIQPLAQAAGVVFESRLDAAATLDSRDGNLLTLVLENLLRNAIEATPRGKVVRLGIAAANGNLLFRVQDQGPGLPATVREELFRPCHSTKTGGHGLGLAISQQLARHIGAELKLERSSEAGCVFTLGLPLERPVSTDPAHATAASTRQN
ncbi:MAG: HAMP domain-containing histidine kinase [Verrucomicrobia bacterium]|nr:HAMP domain-containing histidine kinase [Verrucomicrobiota bacterium]